MSEKLEKESAVEIDKLQTSESTLPLDEQIGEDAEAPSKPSFKQRLHDFFWEFYNSPDWFAAYIGISWFLLIIVLAAVGYNSTLAVPSIWHSNPLDAFNIGLAGIPILFVVLSLQILGVMYQLKLLKGEKPILTFYLGFAFQFVIAFICMFLGSQEYLHRYGLGHEIWAIILGTLVINVTAPFLPMEWSQLAASQGEFYIKCGLVLLGIDLGKIAHMGLQGIVVGWVVPPIQVVCMWFFGTRVLKMENKKMVLVLAVGSSVCGCSAMAALAPSLKFPKEQLSLCISLLSLFTLLFTFITPLLAIAMKLPMDMAGAWMGGCVNNTANVIAAAGIIGPDAVEIAGIVKMIQNCILGFVVVGVCIFWSSRGYEENPQKPGLKMLWEKFPKFAIGFFIVSVLITILNSQWDDDYMKRLDKLQADGRTWLFTMGFVGIGLTTHLRQMLRQLKGGMEVAHYLSGQTMNIIFTLFAAYIMFMVF